MDRPGSIGTPTAAVYQHQNKSTHLSSTCSGVEGADSSPALLVKLLMSPSLIAFIFTTVLLWKRVTRKHTMLDRGVFFIHHQDSSPASQEREPQDVFQLITLSHLHFPISSVQYPILFGFVWVCLCWQYQYTNFCKNTVEAEKQYTIMMLIWTTPKLWTIWFNPLCQGRGKIWCRAQKYHQAS